MPDDVDGCEFAAGDFDAGGVHRRIAFAADKTLGYLVFCRSLLFAVRTMSVIKYSAGHRPVAKRSKQTCERPNAFADGLMAGASRRGGSATWTRISARTSVVRPA
jgi:hypothetical protein